MAVEVFKVIVGQASYGSGIQGLTKEFTKEEAEAVHGKLKEKVIIKGPMEDVQVIEIEAANAEQAALAAKFILRAEQTGSKFVSVKAANYTETTV